MTKINQSLRVSSIECLFQHGHPCPRRPPSLFKLLIEIPNTYLIEKQHPRGRRRSTSTLWMNLINQMLYSFVIEVLNTYNSREGGNPPVSVVQNDQTKITTLRKTSPPRQFAPTLLDWIPASAGMTTRYYIGKLKGMTTQ